MYILSLVVQWGSVLNNLLGEETISVRLPLGFYFLGYYFWKLMPGMLTEHRWGIFWSAWLRYTRDRLNPILFAPEHTEQAKNLDERRYGIKLD